MMTVTILIKVIIQQQRQPILWPLCSRQLLLAGTPHLRIGGFCSSKVLLPACSLLMATSAFGLWSSVVTIELALTLACSLILSRLDYCNAVLHGAPASSTQKLQRVQNTAARVVLQSARWSPSQPLLQHHTSTPVYLSRNIQPCTVTRQLRSSAMPWVCKPTTRTNFADRAFRCSAPAVWNSLTANIVDSSSLLIFKRKLKTFLFRHAFSSS